MDLGGDAAQDALRCCLTLTAALLKLMEMLMPVADRCAGCRAEMLVPDAALDVSESRCDAAVCAAAVCAAAVCAAAERRCSCARCSPAKAAAGAKGCAAVQQQRCRWRCWTSTAVPLSGRFKMCAIPLTCTCCELGGDVIEELAARVCCPRPRAPTTTTAAIAMLHKRLMILMF